MTHQLIEYIHIPKCGGTFIKNLLETFSESTDSDLSCKAYRKKHGDCTSLHIPYHKHYDFSKNFFAVIRDPYTRLVSNYYYDLDNWKKLFGHENCLCFDTFVNYLYINPKMIYMHIHLYPQSYFLKNSADSRELSENIHLFSFNDLPFNIYYFFKEFNIPVKNYNLFQQMNQQENISYDITPLTREKISFIYAEDFRLLKNFF